MLLTTRCPPCHRSVLRRVRVDTWAGRLRYERWDRDDYCMSIEDPFDRWDAALGVAFLCLFCGWIGGRGMVRLAGWWGAGAQARCCCQ